MKLTIAIFNEDSEPLLFRDYEIKGECDTFLAPEVDLQLLVDTAVNYKNNQDK